MSPDVAVLLPTAGRPDMLRTALRSVERQTARDRIRVVVVSENMGDERSRLVCAEFPGLPIRFVRREPPLRPIDHATVLFSEEHGAAYSAVLHDDDWWRPGHLARSLLALDHHPTAVVSYGGYWCVIGERSSFVGHQENNLWWIAAGRPEADADVWTLGHLEALIVALGGGLGHYSSLVARTEVLRKATAIYRLGNPMDNDRMLTAEFSRHGDVLYHPLPELFVRQHPTQDFRRFGDEEYVRLMSSTTCYVIKLAREGGLDLRAALDRLHANHPAELQRYLAAHFAPAWCRGPLLAEGMLPEFLQRHRNVGESPAHWRQWIPPALATLVRHLRR
jgi:glycosyltransferase involved in cell wall biosynthesis